MKKFICLLALFLLSESLVFSQHKILIRYLDEVILTPVNVQGYMFSTWNFKEFEISDSLFYVFVKQKVDSMELCPNNNIKCRFPNVRQQIIILNGEEYDILSSDGVFAMEKNGKKVIFDKTLQTTINQAINSYKDYSTKKGSVPKQKPN